MRLPRTAIRKDARQGAASTARPTAVCFALAAALGSASCAQATDRPDERILAAITASIGLAQCDNEGQCRVIGVGSNPCGGPEQYLAWSTRSTDARSLHELVARYAEQRRKFHEQAGLSSQCALLPEPGVRCERQMAAGPGRCVLVPPPPGGGLIR